MAKLIIMKGLPASGKSTKAAELLKLGGTIRLNKDLLRTMLHCDKFTGKNESHTRDASRVLAEFFLHKGINVIVDDTNLNPRTLQSWVDLGKEHAGSIEYHDLSGVPVEECLIRDRSREKEVGDHVILKMALEHLDLWKKEKVVIVDIDGTIADIEHRRHHVRDGKKEWRTFFSLMGQDDPRLDVMKSVENVAMNEKARIVLVSGRSEEYRKDTEQWLKTFMFKYDALIMRESNDSRADTDTKTEIYERYLKNLDIVKVFDDRPSVIRMWREKGLLVEDVGNGVEF